MSDVEFKAGDEQHSVEIEVVYDGEREMREAFTVHMKPDDNMVAEIQVTRSRCPVCVRARTVLRKPTHVSVRCVRSVRV